jgi:hypothetical protein
VKGFASFTTAPNSCAVCSSLRVESTTGISMPFCFNHFASSHGEPRLRVGARRYGRQFRLGRRETARMADDDDFEWNASRRVLLTHIDAARRSRCDGWTSPSQGEGRRYEPRCSAPSAPPRLEGEAVRC